MQIEAVWKHCYRSLGAGKQAEKGRLGKQAEMDAAGHCCGCQVAPQLAWYRVMAKKTPVTSAGMSCTLPSHR